MTNKRTSIDELVGQTITKAEYVDGQIWFDIEITTADGFVLTNGGYFSDAGATLERNDETIREWK